MKLTMRKIAAEAGISPATVSRYLNGTVNVSDELADRIEKAVNGLGGEVRKKGRESCVFILVTNLGLPFYSQALKELLSGESVYHMILIHYDPRFPDMVKNFAQVFKPVGAIYFEEEIDDAILSYLQGRSIRTVMLGGTAPNSGSEMVRVNDLAAAYAGTNYLLGLGHRKILFLSDEVRKISAGFQRITGCRQALEEHSLTLEPSHVYYREMTFRAGYDAVKDALAKGTEFTAVFGFSDETAIGAMAALYDAGISVPQQVSVLGYDDLEIAEHIRPSLTTIHQPIDLFVKKALDLFGDPDLPPHTEILLPYTIRERDSCRHV